MKCIAILGILVILLTACGKSTVVQWITTTPVASWQIQEPSEIRWVETDAVDAEIRTDTLLQTIDGFGACFNELGWTALSCLSETQRNEIFHELFSDAGAHFSVCRMPVGANDFSRDWYSYNETDGDFDMHHFTIVNDRKTLIPFIHAAQKHNPKLQLWASPWSPPTWMKENHFYACAVMDTTFFDARYNNFIAPEQVRCEGLNMFISEEKYYAAYARYFKKFIEAYGSENIRISMVMPQNEFNSCQPFPSCTWQAGALAEFTGKYLAPVMQSLGVAVMFGTMERSNPALVDTVLAAVGGDAIQGVGFQWAGRNALATIHTRYPQLKIYQTEQECGDGQNSWDGCRYAWELMQYYLTHGTNVYEYWNIALLDGGMSRWGWTQNSLVTVNETEKTYRYTYEYYLMKHFSHYILPGAQRLQTTGVFGDCLAFRNTDATLVLILHNAAPAETTRRIRINGKALEIKLQSQSIHTLLLR
jgi:glucosylceramidase